MADTPKPVVPDHDLLRVIGRGSYGEVWLARNVMGTYRAVKVVHRDAFRDAQPFEREFHGIQKFEPVSRSHSGLMDILQMGRADGYFYYVMEVADDVTTGPSIDPNHYAPRTLRSEVAAHGRLPVDQCVNIGLALAEALGHLHASGLVHRDVKPSNIIFVHGQPKLADIGLVSEQSEARSFVGTEGFIPPEGPGTVQADLYGLGKLLYELATGNDRNQFPALPREAIVGSSTEAGLQELNAVILRACEAETGRRYRTAEQIRDDLLLLKSGRSVRRAQQVERRLALALKLGVFAAIVAVLAGGFSLWMQRQTQRERENVTRLQVAEANARDQLWNSLLAQAQANRRTTQPGRRLKSLELLERAANLPVPQATSSAATLALRNESIACLALPDLGPPQLVTEDDSTDRRPCFDEAIERYAKVDSNGVVHVHRISPDEELFQLPAATNSSSRVWGFSPDGRFLALTYSERHLRIWDLERRQIALALDGVGPVRVAAFAPDNRTIAVGNLNGDESITLSELDPAEPIRTLTHGPPLSQAQFSTDGRFLATVPLAGNVVEIIEVRSGQLISRLTHSMQVYAVAWHTDNRLVAVGCLDLQLYLWNPMSGRLCASLSGHRSAVVAAAFHPSGSLMASSSWDGTTRLWDLAAAEPLCEVQVSGPDVRFSPDGRRMGVTSYDFARLFVVPVEAERVCHSFVDNFDGVNRGGTGGYLTTDFSPDERYVVAAGHSGVRVWDRQGTGMASALATGAGRSAIWRQSGNELIASAAIGFFQWQVESSHSADEIAFRAETPMELGEFGMFAAGRSGAVFALVRDRRIQLERGGQPTLQLTPADPPSRIAISPDERWLAATTWPGRTTRIWDIGSGELVHEFDTVTPTGIAFAPDSGQLVIAAGQEYAFFEVRTGAVTRRVPVDVARAVAFSHDGRVLAITVRHSLIKLLDASTLEELATLEAASAPDIVSLTFSASDTQLAVAGTGHSIQTWDLRSLRRELAARNLDWRQPPYSGSPPVFARTRFTFVPGIPPRSPHANPRQVDLTKHYNLGLSELNENPRDSLVELTPGMHTFGGVRYDIRGCIQLRRRAASSLPDQVSGISIAQSCRRLHFVGAVCYLPARHEVVATHRIHYADGRTVDLPLVAGRDLDGWWFRPEETDPELDVAWTGSNPAAARQGYRIRLFHFVWENPRPEHQVESLDFISALGNASPFLVAITAE